MLTHNLYLPHHRQKVSTWLGTDFEGRAWDFHNTVLVLELLATVAELNNLPPTESNLRWPRGYQHRKTSINLLLCKNKLFLYKYYFVPELRRTAATAPNVDQQTHHYNGNADWKYYKNNRLVNTEFNWNTWLFDSKSRHKTNHVISLRPMRINVLPPVSRTRNYV